jgi:hypothetical protein
MDVLYAAAGLVLLGGTGSRDSAMKRLCGTARATRAR